MMSRGQIAFLQITVAGMALTGIVYAWMKYAMKSSDPFAVVNHPWQPHMLSAHVVIGPLAVFAFGWTFANHMWPAFVNRAPNRMSGLWSMLLIAPMTLSGYLMQITTDDAVRKAFAVSHWISCGAFVIAYVVHLVPVKSS